MGKIERKLTVQMKDHAFSGDDPITVLGFLARYKDACDKNEISEGAALWAVQFFLKGQAGALVKSRLAGQTMAMDSERGELLTCYKELVNFLLHTYATDDVMAETVADVEGLKQSTSMTETGFSDELWRRALRCGTVFSSRRIRGYFVEGVLPAIRTQLRDYAARHPYATYESIVRYARGLGTTYRAMRRVNVPVGFKDNRDTGKYAKTRSIKVDLVDTDSEYGGLNSASGEGDEVLALSYGSTAPHSPNTTGTPSIEFRTPDVAMRSFPGTGQQPPPKDAAQTTGVAGNNRVQRCYICLSPNHTVCDLFANPADRDRVLAVRQRNYEQLSAERAKRPPIQQGYSGFRPTILRRPPGQRVPGTPVYSLETESDAAHGAGSELMPIPGQDDQPIPEDLAEKE